MSKGLDDILRLFSEGETFKELIAQLSSTKRLTVDGLVGSAFVLNCAASTSKQVTAHYRPG